ncbi:arrestin domain-containing protein 17-like [Cydia splendana]|uniref:arrestin domain-containing protein 17-like n=1 Tax=Cydia splendana TaxID=1100963 RepID=UPI0021399A2B
MGFDEGRLVLDSDNGSYFAGQTVNAKLIFNPDKVKTFRGIYAKIKGFCKVHWTTSHSRRVPDGRGGHRTEHYTETHESHEVYVERKIYLVGGESGEHRIQPGKHEYPFNFPLPANCPSSFEGQHGHIRYEIKAVVDRAFKTDQEKKVRLRVIAPLDLNADPYCSEPIEIEMSNTYCCCCMSRGACETLVKLPKGGYCPGQTIPIEVSCENKGNVDIETISFAIEQNTVFHATHRPGTKSSEDTVAKLKKGPIPGNTSRTWTVEMEMPTMDLYNVAACRFIDIDYTFVVKVSPDGCHEDSKERRRIVIGNIPLRGYQDNIPNPMQDQMPKQIENYQNAAPHFGPVVNQPMPYPAPSPYPSGNPYPGAYPGASPYPGANPPYPNASPYPGPHPVSPYPNSPYPGSAQPVSPYPPPYSAVPSLPPGANVPYPTGPTSPFVNASAPGLIPATPDSAEKKNPIDDSCHNPPFNPNFKS